MVKLKNLRMLSPRLTNCVDCNQICNLIEDIDCKLAKLSSNLYNNVVFLLNLPVQGTLMNDLLNYKRILTYKLCNDEYACRYSVESIASRVKLLIHK